MEMEMEGRRSDEQPINPNIPSTDNYFSYFKYDKQRDGPERVRSDVLVVAALVLAATYQAMTNPPDVFKEKPRYLQLLFVYANTLAWSASFSIIEILTDSFPLKVEVRLSTFSLAFAYGIIAGAQSNAITVFERVLLYVCIFAPYVIRTIVAKCKFG
ncbi:hypothetical protein HanRHA438_Chr01g0028611 [Helianthus annuus]|nr:hypothetical protein HanRHA438_Chr01g0028611 [Helianthus annuus]